VLLERSEQQRYQSNSLLSNKTKSTIARTALVRNTGYSLRPSFEYESGLKRDNGPGSTVPKK
jgi:hypothetical protein